MLYQLWNNQEADLTNNTKVEGKAVPAAEDNNSDTEYHDSENGFRRLMNDVPNDDT